MGAPDQIGGQSEKSSLEKALQENANLRARRNDLLRRLSESAAACALLREKYEEATKALEEWEASAGAMLRQNELLGKELRKVRDELLVATGAQPTRTPETAVPLIESRFFADWARRAGKEVGPEAK